MSENKTLYQLYSEMPSIPIPLISYIVFGSNAKNSIIRKNKTILAIPPLNINNDELPSVVKKSDKNTPFVLINGQKIDGISLSTINNNSLETVTNNSLPTIPILQNINNSLPTLPTINNTLPTINNLQSLSLQIDNYLEKEEGEDEEEEEREEGEEGESDDEE